MKQKAFLPSLLALGAMFLFMSIMPTMCLAQPVSRETARRAATTFLDNNGAKTADLTDLTSATGFNNVYVFSTDQSFVLMSADSRVQPVLGYSLNGGFDAEDMPENKRAWIQEYSDGIQYAIEHQTRASNEVAQQWRDLAEGNPETGRATTVVEPLIQTRWDQGNPYNLLCPGGSVTGCVATAMAQVMKYWNYPEHGIGGHFYIPRDHPEYGTQSADFQITYYDWNNMTNTYGSSSTDAQRQAVAKLMYHCGVSVEMNYTPGGSGASTPVVADALKNYFNYSSETIHVDRSGYEDDVWIAMLKAELDLNRPIQYHGTGSGGGHSFVCDGYNSDDYFHFNWGWSGYCDEYYLVNNLNPGPGGIGSGSNGIYNEGQGAIFGIHPSECTASAPANLTFTQDGRNVTLAWTAADGAANYKIYRNMSLIGTTTSTTYDDIALFGDNVYFVRSVDANGDLSLSSNEVTVTVDYQTPMVDDLSVIVYGNSVNLTWTTPEWCYPETPSATLTYGNANNTSSSMGFNNGTTCIYWGHRYPTSVLSAYDDMAVYKVSFFAKETGAYQLFVYEGTDSDHPQTQVLQQTISVDVLGWIDIDLPNTITIDPSQDLWVFMYDPVARNYPAAFTSYQGEEGNYYSTAPTSWVGVMGNSAFLIRTYLTDGTYTYNLYRNDEAIANAIADTHYTDSGLADGTYTYHMTTNYYGGETDPSNSVTVTVPGLVTQTVELAATWTWWTPVVTTTLAELEAAIGSNGILIKSQDGGFARCENGQWSGTLQDFVPGQMYRIATQEADTFTLTGMPVTAAGISILQGYNWFGYMGMQPADIATVLGSFMPAQNDQIIGQEGTATYNGGEWTGDLTTLVPGKGYVYHSTASERKTLLIGQ
ncbi:MAG: C10 family peptidase [Bacteroidales bacterium]|nr:C10 family peptidase [Bacteroidales bacterium]